MQIRDTAPCLRGLAREGMAPILEPPLRLFLFFDKRHLRAIAVLHRQKIILDGDGFIVAFSPAQLSIKGQRDSITHAEGVGAASGAAVGAERDLSTFGELQ